MATQWQELRRSPLVGGAVGLVLVVGLFLSAMFLGRVTSRAVETVFEVGGPGTVSGLVLGVATLQVLGFGSVLAAYLQGRGRAWRSYLRIGDLTEWTLFYGAAVGLALMLVAVGATGLLTVLGIEPAESQAGQATEPGFYAVLFVLSTFVGVPMEELFFRGLLQRRLAERSHPAFAIAVASLLFTSLHTGVAVGSGGAVVALGMFFAFGVVLGTSYDRTGNLLVPIIGHVIFNGVQILLRGLEVAL